MDGLGEPILSFPIPLPAPTPPLAVGPCLIMLAVSLCLAALPASAGEVELRGRALSVSCDPATLEVHVTPVGQSRHLLFGPLEKRGDVVDLQRSEARASWKLRDRGLQVTLQLAGDALGVDFVADEIGVLAWPSVVPGAAVKGWIVPMFEGLYVPADDRRWVSFLAKGEPLDTTADLILPFWGLDFGGFTTTCIVLNPFNNRLKFEDASGRLGMRLAHEFTRNHSVKQFGLRISAGPPSPIEPALEYRRWLQANGRFVSFEEKIRRTPEAEKLLGAAHVYLWGEGLLSADDVRDWRGFARRLQAQGEAAAPSPGKRLWSMIDDEAHRNIITVGGAQPADRYTKGQVAEAVGRALERPDFYEEGAWSGVALDGITEALTKRKAADLSMSDLCRRNCGLLAAAFAAFLAPLDTWGDGISPPMIRQLSDEGFDRLWLGAEGWSGFVKRPETVATARAKGYLIGTYDSYHSIHAPGEADTWPTAQFDAELYSKGAIVQADGTKKRGFQRKGHLLSPKAARPWVEKRVSGLMAIFHANSWFIDCDAFGQYYDDYSTEHPATQESDLAERMSRIAWIRDTYGAVVGSESCSAGAASTLHFAHGVMTPGIGWGDPDLKDRKSKYFLGGYYPPNAPAVFFKSVPLKEEYRYRYFDPRFRLPLFQAVFHDSVIATHHWGSPSFKFTDAAGTVELLELLYGVPPLYHLNRQELGRLKDRIKTHYDFFSALHRELGLLPLTDFRWLTEDRLVQQTVFGDRIVLTANFGERAFDQDGRTIPPGSIAATWRRTEQRALYAPRSDSGR